MWVVVVSLNNYPQKVWGPFQNKDVAEAVARGIGFSGGQTATALTVETP